MTSNTAAPIGVFDSGIGGLTVVRTLLQQLPHENIVYFGDTARIPYGPKGPSVVTRYSREITTFLVDQGVKAVVVACNTATAHALEVLRASYDIPIIGVIDPGARAAARATRSKRIGVIGTQGMVASRAYDRAIHATDPSIEVIATACPLFVPLVEEGWLDREATRLIAMEYLTPLTQSGIDTLVLGCTHYPLIKAVISDIMGSSIQLIDSAEETAVETAALLRQNHLTTGSTAPAKIRFVASDVPDQFMRIGQRFLGSAIDRVETVTLG
jgi:glutamate racemase